MKKIFLVISTILIVSAGCDSTTETIQNQVKDETITIPAYQESIKTKQLSSGSTKKPNSEDSQSNCDPNYSGCVPVASDVDCAGGSGNGPAYVRGPVNVIGSDIYGLDRDGNGVGCE